MKVLILGDTHIPRRAKWLPRRIELFLSKEKFDVVLCTGDLTDERVLEYLEGLGEVFVVRGNMDHLPFQEVRWLKVEDLKVGLIHGHQVYPRSNREQLKEIAVKMDVDLLVSGHTHSPDIYLDDVLLLNPGSATGAWGGGGGSLKPSFMVLEVSGRNLEVYLYELEDRLRCKVGKKFTFG